MDDNLKYFIIAIVSILLVNALFIELAKYFNSNKPPKDGEQNNPPRKRNKPLAICLYLLVITVDIIFIVWLVTDGKHILSSIIDFDFFYKVVDAVLC